MTSNSNDKPEKQRQEAAGAAPVESFGRYLMHQRELRGMTIEQIADQTRVLASNLRCLEQDDYSGMPVRVFLVGWIRAYAQAIGLNPDEATLRYDEQMQRSAPPEAEEVARRRPRRRRLAAVLFAAAIAAAVGFGIWLMWNG